MADLVGTLLALLILMPLAAAYVRLVRRERRRRELLDIQARVARAQACLVTFVVRMEGLKIAMADATKAMERFHRALANTKADA